jgi:propanol-preferring alcohol dehydrogenase
MKAMVLTRIGTPLQYQDVPDPHCGPGSVLVKVNACAVCRTDLHVVDGELPDPKLPLIPGHEIVGEVVQTGEGVIDVAIGDRVGIPWLGYSCGHCRYCRRGQENLCDNALFTGYQLDGGYAQFTVADHRYVFPIADDLSDVGAAPLLCAGLIGYRSLRMCGDAERLGMFGFGAAAHVICQVAVHQGREVYAFTREGDTAAQEFARSLGAVWAGSSTETSPEPLDAAIIFAPVGELVPAALRSVVKGGTVVCAGIHMSPIPSFPYRILWGERVLRSVANLTRKDGEEFLQLAPQVPVTTHTETYALQDANEALHALRSGSLHGAAVLVPPH